jgi:hypothetical protein
MSNQPTEYTIAMWVRPSVAATAGLAVRTPGDPTAGWSHALYQFPGYFLAYTYDGAVKYVYGATVPAVGEWHHVAVTARNGGVMRLYVNGVEEGTAVAITTLWTGGNDWWIGRDDPSTTTNYAGHMAEAAIWYKELTAAEVLALKGGAKPSSVQAGSLRLYCEMSDTADGVDRTSNWTETVGGLTQTRTGNVTGDIA